MSKVQTHPLNMVCGNTYVFSTNGQEYTSKLESKDGGKITFENEQTFDAETTTTKFYECRVNVVEKLLEDYKAALGSIEEQTLTEDFKNAVSAIIKNPTALDRMRDCNKDFKYVYEYHYVERKKMFKDDSWDLFTSMCQSLIMCEYH